MKSPILNSPYFEPNRHFRSDTRGLTEEVTHAYFLGGNKPYEKLKKALKSDIKESAWNELYSTVARPFPKPKSGKIAVKVINHYGDEVMKIIEIH